MEKHLGYILERVVSNQKQEVCCNCTIQIEGLDPCIRRPLILKSIEAACIHPVCDKREAFPCHPQSPESETVRIDLICWVEDACGCISKGYAQVELDVCAAKCAGNVRRGAEIALRQAMFCGACTFEIRANICLYTVVSRSELIQRTACEVKCPQLPLYPVPPKACRIRGRR